MAGTAAAPRLLLRQVEMEFCHAQADAAGQRRRPLGVDAGPRQGPGSRRGGGRGQAAESHKGGGHDRAQRARGRDRQVRGERRQARAERRGQDQAKAERRLNQRERRVERAIQNERREVRQARRDDRVDRRERRLAQAPREDRRDWRRWSDRRLVLRDRFDDDFFRRRGDRGRHLANRRAGCPPGLARQNRFCMPPGQLRKARFIGRSMPIASWRYNVPVRYRYRFLDDRDWFYRYDNAGYVYRFDRGSRLVNAVYPLFGSDLIIGEPMPLGYQVYNVPIAYRSFYPDTRDYYYRYDDSAIYRVRSDTMLVDGIVALLSGGGGLGGLGVGDPLPIGYDAYNVPYAYRDRYHDSGDAWYRYADNSTLSGRSGNPADPGGHFAACLTSPSGRSGSSRNRNGRHALTRGWRHES